MPTNKRVLIIESRFYEDIADQLALGAETVLKSAGVDFDRVAVPGAFEIPPLIRYCIRSMELGSSGARYAGFITLGCVIRGETGHYDHVCREVSHAMMRLTLQHSLAHGFGILTVENYQQAVVRAAADGEKNHGGRAAEACLRLMELKQQFHLVAR